LKKLALLRGKRGERIHFYRIRIMNLIKELVKRKILDRPRATNLEYEVKSSGKKEEEILIEKKIVSEDFLFNLKSDILKIPLKTILADDISLKALEVIPEESAKYYKMVPLKKEGKQLEVGMVYPEDLKAREALEFLARRDGLSYKVFLLTISNFKNVLKRYRSLRKEVGQALEELQSEFKKKEEKEPGEEIKLMVEEAPISKVVAVILRHAVDGGASDIHIEPGREKLRVRFRLDGILHSSIFLPMKIAPAVASRIKILSNLKIDETRIPQDGRFSTKIDERSIDFRVSTFPTLLGEKVVMRVLDSSQRKETFDNLGIFGDNLKKIKDGLKKSYGMILATGPTGSGKTTTLYSILELLNKEGVNIVTLEDPVEYFIEGVSQSQVRPELGYTFASGLRSILRQDPDILMVGEIRDKETASLAIHASLTGHLVLSTLHTANTIGAIPRLIDMGVPPFLLPPTLSIVIAQRLARKLCPYCRKKVKASQKAKEIISEEINSLPKELRDKYESKLNESLEIYEPVGCKRCNNTGYSGRVGIFEVLKMTDSLSRLILEKPSEDKIFSEAKKQGIITMKQDGILKVLDGTTSLEEILRVAEEK